VLKDENEYARRAAVEVLNVVGTSKSVKYLLEVIADSGLVGAHPAADALGKIGGPRVVDAVLTLIKDENQDIRRAAIEILNQTKDERAVAQLIEATKDKDWWVCERAVDALAEIGATRPCRASSNAGQLRGQIAAHRDSRRRQIRRPKEHRSAPAAAAEAGKRSQSGDYRGAREAGGRAQGETVRVRLKPQRRGQHRQPGLRAP